MNAKRFWMLVAIVVLVITLGAPAALAQESRESRLVRLDAIFRSGGVEAWLKAAGFSWVSLQFDARNIEEETISYEGTRVVASGIQVTATGLQVLWPAIVTTGTPSAITKGASTRMYQPDLRNPSTLYSNVEVNGAVTIWVDASNWAQLWPEGYAPVGQESPKEQAVGTGKPVSPWPRFPWEWVLGILAVITALLAIVLLFRLSASSASAKPKTSSAIPPAAVKPVVPVTPAPAAPAAPAAKAVLAATAAPVSSSAPGTAVKVAPGTPSPAAPAASPTASGPTAKPLVPGSPKTQPPTVGKLATVVKSPAKPVGKSPAAPAASSAASTAPGTSGSGSKSAKQAKAKTHA